KQFIEFAAFGVCQAFCCLVSIGLQARFEKLQLIISRPAKGGELLGKKLATCSPLKASWPTSHPGVRLRIRKANLRGTILEWHLKRYQQRMVSIHRPLGYGPDRKSTRLNSS